jgi:hypothetical protein
MKEQTITIFLAFFLVSSYAQKQFGIKIYQNTDFFKTEYRDRSATVKEFRNRNFNRLTVALGFTNRRLTHEIEIFIPEISRSDQNIQYPFNHEFTSDFVMENRVSAYSFRYELYKTFAKKDNKFAFRPGVGINPYYLYVEYIPNVANYYPRTHAQYGITLNVTPRITYIASKRWVFDLNVPLRIYDLRESKSSVKNPAIPIKQQTMKRSSNIFVEDVYTIRLGIMYNLHTQLRQ